MAASRLIGVETVGQMVVETYSRHTFEEYLELLRSDYPDVSREEARQLYDQELERSGDVTRMVNR